MLATRDPYFGVVPGNILFLIALIVASALFLHRSWVLYRLMRLGGPDARLDDLGGRIAVFFRDVLGQGRLLKDPYSGIMHALLFWGFIVITVMTATYWVGGVVPQAPTWVVDQNPAFLVMLETFQLAVLVALGMAFLRRLALHPNRLTYNTDALIILSLIATLMITAFLATATQIAYERRPGDVFAYASNLLAPAFAGWAPGTVFGAHVVFWWMHNLTVLAFLTYLPRSKHLHIVTSPFNVFFRSSRPRGQLSYVDIEKALEQDPPKLGVGEITDLSWKHILDTYTCTECGRCEAECPASRTGKPLSPKKLILDLKDYLLEEGPHLLEQRGDSSARAEGLGDGTNGVGRKPRLVGDVIIDDVLWDCTTCRACMQACPVFIEHVPKIVDMRRHLVLAENRFAQDTQRLFDNLEASGNPWRFPAASRGDWAKDLGIPLIGQDATVEDVDVVYWVGCAGSFDERNQRIARAFAQLCAEAGLKVGILGTQESCTGDPARRAGNEYLFQVLAQQNVQTLNGLGVKRVVATCPHCFNMIRNEYPQLGGQYQVQHHTQFLAELVAAGKLKPQRPFDQSLAYHDPCYLGRYHDLYDQPRSVLDAVPGVQVREVHGACREKGMCCGAGGARVFMEETRGRKINHLRLEQLQSTQPQGLATACPYCIIMLEDATRTKGVSDALPVLDISEVLVASVRPKEQQPSQATRTTA
jgi:Fe-S oxidoreductase